MPKTESAPTKCGECCMFAGLSTFGPCMWPAAPCYLQERHYHDKPACIPKED